VIALPPTATLLGRSAFTPLSVLSYDDRSAISFQCHPEFTPDYATALIGTRSHAAQDAAQSIQSLSETNDCARIGTWLRNFLDESRAQDSSS
jgi:GMP synthase-like glutamine amidotransferase